MNKVNGEKYYIKDNKVYYNNCNSMLKSMEVINGGIRINHHDNCNTKISNEVYNKMKKMLIDYYHRIALEVNEFINQLPAETMIRVHGNIIETIYQINNNYINYDFYMIYHDSVSSGYYWTLRLKRDDYRIGKRKLYTSNKGVYFIENGLRNYLYSFYKIK